MVVSWAMYKLLSLVLDVGRFARFVFMLLEPME